MPAAGDIWPATGILPRLIAVAGDARFDVHLAGLDEGTGNNVGRVGPADVGAQKKPAGEEGDKFFTVKPFGWRGGQETSLAGTSRPAARKSPRGLSRGHGRYSGKCGQRGACKNTRTQVASKIRIST